MDRMKKTKTGLALFLTLAVGLIMMPQTVFASQDLSGKQILPSAQASEQETLLQIMDEVLHNITEGEDVPLTEVYYAPEVIAAVNQEYSDIMEYVRENPDEVEYDGAFVYVSKELSQRMSGLESLMLLKKNVYSGAEDSKALKDQLKKKYNKINKKRKKYSYNEWYRDQITIQRTEAGELIDAVCDISSYIAAGRAKFFATYVDENDLYYDEGYLDLRESMTDNGVEEDTILSTRTLRDIVECGQSILDKDLESADLIGFNPSRELKKAMNSFTSRASKKDDLSGILLVFDRTDRLWQTEYKGYIRDRWEQSSEDLLTESDQIRWYNAMQRNFYACKKTDYTSKNYRKIEGLFEDYIEEIFETDTVGKAEKLYKKYTKKMKKIPKKKS